MKDSLPPSLSFPPPVATSPPSLPPALLPNAIPFSREWCRRKTSCDVTDCSVLPDNTPTPPGLPQPQQQGELLCPGGMCAMTHRLLSPTQDTHGVVVYTHTHTSTKCIGAVDGQKEGVLVGCKGGLMEMLPGQPVSQHSSDPGNACGLLNQWQY